MHAPAEYWPNLEEGEKEEEEEEEVKDEEEDKKRSKLEQPKLTASSPFLNAIVAVPSRETFTGTASTFFSRSLMLAMSLALT